MSETDEMQDTAQAGSEELLKRARLLDERRRAQAGLAAYPEPAKAPEDAVPAADAGPSPGEAAFEASAAAVDLPDPGATAHPGAGGDTTLAAELADVSARILGPESAPGSVSAAAGEGTASRVSTAPALPPAPPASGGDEIRLRDAEIGLAGFGPEQRAHLRDLGRPHLAGAS